MSDENLREQLQELHSQLQDATRADAHVKDMLGSLMEDIVKIVTTEEVADAEKESVKQQLEEHAADFENRHPRLAATIRQVMDLLAKMGI